MRRITKQQPKKPGEYRYLRCLTMEQNMKRLSWHVKRLQRKLHGDRCLSVLGLKNVRRVSL